MHKPAVRHFLTIVLVLLYINRGFFISGALEMESKEGEINSVVEFLIELITGESNDIDEDGDNQTDCNPVQIAQPDISQHLTRCIETANLLSEKISKFGIPNKENLPNTDFFSKIEQPPEMV